jgi:Putative transmembrane protein (PGPGW)
VKKAAKRVGIVVLGWLLVVVGIAALVLPGPGLLALFAGVALLATQYEWAERRVEPVRKAALRGAADSVKSWPRMILSGIGVLWLVGFGVLWILDPEAPGWWPIDEKWWLVGGWATGATLVASGLLVAAMFVYSYHNFRDIEDEQHAERTA